MFLTDQDNFEDLLTKMPEGEREKYERYGHRCIVSAFINRTFIVYRAHGKGRPPELLATLSVVDFQVSPDGALTVIENMENGLRETIGYIPKRIFDFPVFLALPPVMDVRYDARVHNGAVSRWVAFGLLVKTRNRSDFYSERNIYLETPNNFKKLYPTISPPC